MPKPNNKPLPPCMSPGFYSAYDPDHWRARESAAPSIAVLLFIVAMATAILWLVGPTVFGVASAILNGLAGT